MAQPRALIDDLCRRLDYPMRVEYWDGSVEQYGDAAPRFTLQFRDEATCRGLFDDLPLRFGEAYVAGTIGIEGDLVDVVGLLSLTDLSRLRMSLWGMLRLRAMTWRQRNTLRRAKDNIAHHYDLGNEFFALWLGREMAYSCAYFEREDDDIDTAQRQKFAHICRKLHLAPDQTLLDIGCGFGGLLIHAARHYGVRGVGITLSAEQHALAQQRVAEAGLDDRVTIRLQDYRDLAGDGAFDRVVSVGMLEHVGLGFYPAYFRKLRESLKPGGLCLVQSIGRRVGEEAPSWIKKYIFPGMYLPSLAEMSAPAAAERLYVTDVETWRLHYAMTLERWLQNFDANRAQILAMHGEAFVRMWRLYLSTCISTFRHGELTLWQVSLSHGRVNDLPLTRRYLYEDAPAPANAPPGLNVFADRV